VKGLSPDFVQIIEQAETAQQLGLEQISGVGYRKALEFLVKDYAIKSSPTSAEEIKAMPLAKCITQFVKSERVQEVAKRAVWLGNDETHYVRKWEGKDLKDLKALIHLTVSWIDMEFTTADVLREMPEAK
jgi:hypothetical protein